MAHIENNSTKYEHQIAKLYNINLVLKISGSFNGWTKVQLTALPWSIFINSREHNEKARIHLPLSEGIRKPHAPDVKKY